MGVGVLSNMLIKVKIWINGKYIANSVPDNFLSSLNDAINEACNSKGMTEVGVTITTEVMQGSMN
jgi:hypothetical protein